MSLGGATVPRKIGELARAFADHAEADAEETAAMMAQVRRAARDEPHLSFITFQGARK